MSTKDGKVVSRSLSLYDIDGEGKFSILPTLHRPFSLIISSSISCIDKGASLTIIFDDKSEIRLSNWNDFNCKGTAYFNLSQSEIEKLKEKKVKNISFYVENGKSQFANVAENESDYFIQYTELLK